MYTPFFGKPFKLIVLSMLLALTIALPSVYAQDETPLPGDHELMMDLVGGGADLYNAVKHGVIQIISGSEWGLMGGVSAGSGYIFDKEGYAITNRHVTDHNPYFEITFWGDEEHSRNMGYRYKGILIAEDPALDLGVIKVEAPSEKFEPVKLGNSGDMKIGDVVATCGSPGAAAGTVNPSSFLEGWLEYFNVNLGVLKEILPFENAFYYSILDFSMAGGTHRELYGTAQEYLFHVDAAINHGNSGGPCFNAYGEAVGTNTWGSWYGENVGLSVPTDLLKNAVADIIAYGRVRRPWVGISLHPEVELDKIQGLYQTGKLAGANIWFDITPPQLKIITVNPYSPAYKAGIREGDIIERIDGKKYKNIFDIYSYFLHADLGQLIEFKILRNNMPMAITVEVGEKKIRYFGADVNAGTFMGIQDIGNVSVRTFHSPVTY